MPSAGWRRRKRRRSESEVWTLTWDRRKACDSRGSLSVQGFFPEGGGEIDAVVGIVGKLDDFAVRGF